MKGCKQWTCVLDMKVLARCSWINELASSHIQRILLTINNKLTFE